MIKRVDENGNVRLITNIRKPRKWRRFEYLQSSGTLYIDTGIKIGIDTKFIATVRLTSPTGDSKFIGAYIPGGTICTLLSKWRIYSGSNFYLTNIATNTNKVNIEFSGNIFKVNDLSYTLELAMASSNVNIFLFLANYKGNPTGGDCAIYEYKHYEGDLLVRHMVPAQYNGLYGMWDLVEDKFYGNSGTGTFTVGPEIKNYDEIYEVRRTSSILPAGVELYDYILSSGTLWINTGWTYNTSNTSKISTKFKVTKLGVRQFIYANYNNNPSASYLNFELNSNNTTRLVSYQDNKTGGAVSTNVDYTSETTINNGVATAQITGNNYSATLSDVRVVNFLGSELIFDDYRHTLAVSQSIIMYYFKIWDNNILVRNFLPCTYLGEPGMWDTVENKFYRNQGTGLFTLGNKITLKEYEYLKTVSTAQSIDTGILLTDNHSVAYDIIFKYENNGVRRLMGSSGALSSYFGANANGEYDRYSSISIGNIDHLYEEFNLITKKLVSYINDFKYRENNITADKSKGHCYIFSLNGITNYTGAGQYFYSGKMIYDGKIIRDFIPVSYNGTPGLWDKVEWKFYGNAGSGSFTLGPEKKSGIYPVWTPIEYLESTGTLYIDTGIALSLTDKFEFETDFIYSPANGRACPFYGTASYTTGFMALYHYSNNNLYPLWIKKSSYGGTNISITASSRMYSKTIIDVPNKTWAWTYNSTSASGTYTNQITDTTSTVKFFGNDLYNKYTTKCYYFKIKINDVLVRDFIPVRIGNIGYLFDKVTGKMFGNSGTGNFILGPDINL